MYTLHSSGDLEKLLVSSMLLSIVFKSLWDWLFPALNFLKLCLPKIKVKVNVFNLSDKVNFRFVERQHIFSGSWAVSWEKRIKHLQFGAEFCILEHSLAVSPQRWSWWHYMLTDTKSLWYIHTLCLLVYFLPWYFQEVYK
jgi:hypothetical protein